MGQQEHSYWDSFKGMWWRLLIVDVFAPVILLFGGNNSKGLVKMTGGTGVIVPALLIFMPILLLINFMALRSDVKRKRQAQAAPAQSEHGWSF